MPKPMEIEFHQIQYGNAAKGNSQSRVDCLGSEPSCSHCMLCGILCVCVCVSVCVCVCGLGCGVVWWLFVWVGVCVRTFVCEICESRSPIHKETYSPKFPF